MKTLILRETKEGAVLSVHLQPNAARTACVGLHGDAVKIRVAAPPVDGAANQALIRFLSLVLSVPASAIRLDAGATGRRKRVLIKGVTAEQVGARLLQDGRSRLVTP